MRPPPAAAAAVTVLAAGVAGASVGGPAGAVVVASAAAGLALVIARTAVPGAEPRPDLPPRRHPDPTAGFPSYRRLRSDLGWARTSVRSYDSTLRPVFVRALRSVLADRHRVDLDTNPAAARALVGADLWPLVDPDGTLPDHGDRAGVDPVTVAAVLDCLESLDAAPPLRAVQRRSEETW